MHELHLPWLELALAMPLIGACLSLIKRSSRANHNLAVIVSGASLLFSLGAWEDFNLLKTYEAHDRWDLLSTILGSDAIVIDELNAPLFALCSLIFLLTILATPPTKATRFPFGLTLISQTITMAIFACRDPWAIAILMIAQTVPPFIELILRKERIGAFTFHMGLFAITLVGGLWLLGPFADVENHSGSMLPVGMLIVATLIRNGCAPLHCWMQDLYTRATFGTSLLFTTPMVPAYLAFRVLLPIAPAGAMQTIVFASLFTAVYAAAMALVQRSPRVFFSYILLSHVSLVFVGLETDTAIGMTGSLCSWLSIGIALTGFGLTLRAVEARVGEVSLRRYNGLYRHVPLLAIFFLLTGLASIGFPGTVGFVGTELVVEGVVDLYPWVGTFVVVAAALNSMAIMHGYFRLFTGTEHRATADLKARANEKIAVWVLTILILGGGLVPQPGVASRFHAAVHLLDLEHPAGFVDEANVAEESNAEQSVVIESGGVP